MTLTHSGASELSQLMEGTTAGALIPEIVRRGFQDLLEAEVSALTGAQLHERCPDQRSTLSSDIRFWSSGDTKTGPPDGLLMGALRLPLDRCFIGGCRVVVVGCGICAA
ncbi:hypothetical protein I1E95_15060 [Synechococcus sp. CBW1107]|uniref:hypothetical protein n=1 Tax=Synechococcus sp. CBW1107 TaxID=2789857 RepID=UPI0018CE62C2|nr:hypothetical protein [Synechococcus sp. CBW1107]QPN56374.1 hypothetical protein I1E95_15060 [Synechococcus sp. CBW1107]